MREEADSWRKRVVLLLLQRPAMRSTLAAMILASAIGTAALPSPAGGTSLTEFDAADVAGLVIDLCGNGVVDDGEECDLGAGNGQPTTCCDGCRLVQSDVVCRPAADDCDRAETCNGVVGVCPADAKKAFGSACSDDQNECTDDVCTDSAICVHLPRDGATCGDELFCNGELRCSARGECEDLMPAPCPPDRCDEASDVCLLVTFTPTHTSTPTPESTSTPTAPPSATATATVSDSPTFTASPSPTDTRTGAPTATASPSPTATVSGAPTATISATPTATASGAPTGTPGPCAGDCDGDGTVAINELVLGVNIALGSEAVPACAPFDTDGDGSVSIDELIAGVNNALAGCS